ncbi:MAG: DivIVA domain-containing protein [Euzebya sp.]
MILIVVVAVALGGLLVWALYAEQVPPRGRTRPLSLPVSATGEDVRRHDFPLVLAGYDPKWVDAHLRNVAAILDRARLDLAAQRSVDAASAEVVTLGSVLDDV